MIKPGEIQKHAHLLGVRDQQIEKDYVLSWILYGLSLHQHLKSSLIFKGGTVLKKVYFSNYRFSEDLDFTLTNSDFIQPIVLEWFNELFRFVKEEANIALEIDDSIEIRETGIHFYIKYAGPLGGQNGTKKIKVDISNDEILVFKPVLMPAITKYSDLSNHSLLCYTLEEVLVEKMRTIIQRMQARDFYDVWYLLEEQGMDPTFLINEFKTKCNHKNISPEQFHKKINERIPQYKGRWSNSMKDQIKHLPEFEQVEREMQRHLKRIIF